jgi:hypothetical protein
VGSIRWVGKFFNSHRFTVPMRALTDGICALAIVLACVLIPCSKLRADASNVTCEM